MIDLLLGRCLRDFDLPVFEYYCFAVWCSAADTHVKLLDHVVSGASVLTGGEFECDLAHCRSVAKLCMLYDIRCNPMHPLYGALPVLVRVTCEAAHRYIYCTSRYRTSQYSRTFVPFPVSLWNDLETQYSMVWDWRVSRVGPMPFHWPSCSISFCLRFCPFHSFYGLVLWGWGLRTDRVFYQPFF